MGEPINQYCPKCDDGSKFVKQKWHACQDGDMYYVLMENDTIQNQITHILIETHRNNTTNKHGGDMYGV
jgi:hypothetical protein